MPDAYNRHVLIAWHLESGKTLEEVAFRAEVSYTHLRRLHQGGNPSAALLARLAAVYGRDIRELFTADAESDSAGVR
jgi:transcriptional regulator with XRE-family HTH domain